MRCIQARCQALRQRGESGQIMVLVIGYTVICLLVLTVVMAASSVYIAHKRLLSLADSAAIAAADTFSLGEVAVPEGSVPTPVLDDAAVQEAVGFYLGAASAAERFESLAVGASTGTPDSRTAHVALTAVVHPPIINFLVPKGIPIAVTSDARSELTR